MIHKRFNQRKKICFLCLFLLLAACISPFTFQTAKAEADIDHVQDLADILTDEEEESLREECTFYGDWNEIDIFILTTNSVPENRKLYIEEFYDAHDDILTDTVLILVDMDPDNRGVEIQGYGQCEFSISDDRIDQMLDEVVPYLSDGNYYDAFCCYLKEVDYYMSIEATSDYVHTEQDNINYDEYYAENEELSAVDYIIFNLLLAVGVGAVSVLVMFIFSKLGGGSVTTNRNTYMDTGNSRILGHWDRYIRTTTSRVRKPKENSDGGSNFRGGGVSGGGHSHSGGGRGF